MTYEMVKKNFQKNLWNAQMVRVALDKGIITPAQYEEIVGTAA